MTLVNHETGEIVETLSTEDARRLTDRIRLLAESLADTLEKLADLIDDARSGSAWLALGYRSWTEYVSTEFAGVLPRLDREPRQEFVRELAARGMSTRAIAPIVESSHMTVARDLAGVTDVTPAGRTDVPHDHAEYVNGCFRCDLSRDELPEPRPDAPAASGPEGEASPARPRETEADHRSAPRPPVVGIDGKTYTRPAPIDHAARADAAVAEFPDLAYYRDEAVDLEHCWRLADKLRDFRDRGEFDERLENLRRSIALDRSKRDGTYVSPIAKPDTCPTCGQTVRN